MDEDAVQIQYLFHITHVENLEDISAHGLKSHHRAYTDHCPVDISDKEVNARRSQRTEPIYGKLLHDYVPLYFRARNPMLFRRRDIQNRLATLYVTPRVMRLPGVVFTDGNAASDATQFYNNTEDLNKIDWEVLKAERWTELPDGKRKRCAEVLVPDSISFDSVRRIVVENEHARVAAGHAISFSLPIDVKPEWFF